MKCPKSINDISNIIQQRYNLHVRKLKSKKEVRETGIGHEIFRLINDRLHPLVWLLSA